MHAVEAIAAAEAAAEASRGKGDALTNWHFFGGQPVVRGKGHVGTDDMDGTVRGGQRLEVMLGGGKPCGNRVSSHAHVVIVTINQLTTVVLLLPMT